MQNTGLSQLNRKLLCYRPLYKLSSKKSKFNFYSFINDSAPYFNIILYSNSVIKLTEGVMYSNLKFSNKDNFLRYFSFDDTWRSKALLLKSFYFNGNGFLNLNILTNLNFSTKKLVLSFFNWLFNSYQLMVKTVYTNWYSSLYFIGIGYKIFIYKNFLYLRLGFSRMMKIAIPTGIVVLTRKRNNIKLISSSLEILSDFVRVLKGLRGFDLYKGKGIFELSDFSTIKLKVGKKQQFF